MKNTAKRIGVILASIYTGSSLKLWTELAGEAVNSGNPLFVFSGGRLNSHKESEYLRNGVYALANKENLDGLISWGSSIGGVVSIEEIIQFHHQFEPLPYVTIGQKIGNHAFANFDAYTGMKNLTFHFIREHGAKRLAFIRGPENHVSAAERYTGFCDAVKESGLELDERLITSPFSWGAGEDAGAQLFAERRLIPGKDFDTLIGSSDMLTFAAIRYFQQQGFSVPQHFRAGGFNDSDESLIAESPLSTVHMPYIDLARTAWRMISSLLENPCGDIPDQKIKAPVVIRESCGCNKTKSYISDNDDAFEWEAGTNKKNALISQICILLNSSHPILPSLIEKAVIAFEQKASVQCEALIDQILFYYFKNDGDIAVLPVIAAFIKKANIAAEPYFKEIREYVLFSIPKIQNRIFSAKKYNSMQLIDILNRLKCELLRAHSREELLSILCELLPQIGIHTLSIVLYADNELSSYLGGFAPEGKPEQWAGAGYCHTVSEPNSYPEVFPSQLLFPPDIAQYYKEGCFMVQPLFIENQPIGYFITNISFHEGRVYEDLRAAISSALQGIFLFEETAKAKQIAEQAEFAKTEFFANVGSGLCDPLNEIEDKIDQIEQTLAAHPEATDIISEQLLFIKAQIAAQIKEMSVLVDLTRSQVNDLPMDKSLVYIPDMLPLRVRPEPDAPYPLIFGDKEQIEKALSVISEKCITPVQITAEPAGLAVRFSYAGDSVFADWSYPVYLLAEKIIALHFGQVVKSGNMCTVIFPYPNLAGLPPLKMYENPECVYTVSLFDAKNGMLPDLPVYEFEPDSVLTADDVKPFLLALLPEETPMQDWVKLYGLRNNANVFRAPVICYGKKFAGKSFMEVLESNIRTEKIDPILFIGAVKTRYPLWATDVNAISIGSVNELDRILAEITPALIVFENVGESDIKRIRQIAKTVLVPIIVLPDSIDSEEMVKMLCSYPKVILCNQSAAESEQFAKRIQDILAGSEILPPHTGALVKNAILYLNKHAASQIVRWKLADAVHVSEDYLTRIFHKEIGLSLWEYLNRYRIYLATKMLLETNATIYEIAEKTGFQDQAYFCRVFKKIYGVPPGKIRSKQ